MQEEGGEARCGRVSVLHVGILSRLEKGTVVRLEQLGRGVQIVGVVDG